MKKDDIDEVFMSMSSRRMTTDLFRQKKNYLFFLENFALKKR